MPQAPADLLQTETCECFKHALPCEFRSAAAISNGCQTAQQQTPTEVAPNLRLRNGLVEKIRSSL